MNAFSTANTALVAYALVEPDGTSPDLNSGVTTSRIDVGVYEIVLPGDPGTQEILQEGQGGPFTEIPQYGGSQFAGVMRDLIFVSPILRGTGFNTIDGACCFEIQQQSPFVVRVYFFLPGSRGQNAHDHAFSIMIHRSTINPPRDDVGNYTSPA